ncbi:MAG: cytochrome P450 [Deltaproteobacteria bacterium]|nr:MAG: cytochrome P450 [Deltaproteobacteria bacterium]
MATPERELALEAPIAPTPAARTGLPPGPATWPPLQMLRYARRPYGSIEENARQFGSCWTVRAPGQPPIVSFSDPDAIKVIFTADVDEVHGGEGQAPILGPILGWKSVLVLDGARHRRERRLLMPPFHGERMHLYGLMMREITDRVIDRWPLGQPFPVHREMQTITLDVILRAVFGLDEGAQLARVRDTLLRALKLFDGAAAAFLAIPALQMELGGLTPWGRFVRHRRDVDGVLRAEIARRRADGTAGRTDVLSMLVEARDEHGEPMTDQELLDEMFTILGAGHETTAISMSWALHHVLGRPDVLERIEAEHRSVAGEGPVEPALRSRPLRRHAAEPVQLLPLRGRRAAMPGRGVRELRDEGGARPGAVPGEPQGGVRLSNAAGPACHHRGAVGRHAGGAGSPDGVIPTTGSWNVLSPPAPTSS